MKKNLKRITTLFLTFFAAFSFSAVALADEPTSFSVGKAVAPAEDKIVKVDGINYEITAKPNNFPGKCSVSVNNLCTIANVIIPSQITVDGNKYDVTAIGENAFAENKYIKTIKIGSNVETIAPTAFVNTLALEDFSVDSASKSFLAVDGIIYTKDKTTVVACPPEKKIASFTAPNTVTSIAACAFYGNNELYSIMLSNNKLSEIGDFAFTNCHNLSVVNMGYTVNKIGMAAFAQTDLKTIVLPAYLNEMGSGAFAGTKITTVKIPDSIKEIPYGAFSNCIYLTSVKWGNKLEKINDYAFANTALKTVEITEFVKSIGYCSFAECENLTKLTLGKRLNTIENNAFQNCKSLTSVSIPASVNKIGENVFLNCSKMISVNVETQNTTYVSEDGVLYTKGYQELIYCPDAREQTSFTILGSTVNIRENAFRNVKNIYEFNVSPGNRAYTAEDGVLYSIDLLTLVQYPVGKISNGYTIPDHVHTIMPGAFADSQISGVVNISANITEIGENAFASCQNIKEFNVVPTNSSYTSIDGVLYTKDKAFLINYPAKKVTEVFEVPAETAVISANAFAYAEINEIILPENTVEIGERAFAYSKLSNINLPEKLNVIDDRAFLDTMLVNIDIPSSVTEIGKYAFADSKLLSTVTFTGAPNVTTVGANVFANDISITKIYVPSAYMPEYKMLLINMDVDNYADLLSPKL